MLLLLRLPLLLLLCFSPGVALTAFRSWAVVALLALLFCAVVSGWLTVDRNLVLGRLTAERNFLFRWFTAGRNSFMFVGGARTDCEFERMLLRVTVARSLVAPAVAVALSGWCSGQSLL